MIPELQSPDTFHLLAAHGWLELGNHLEANQELEKIAPQMRAHPQVLEVRWQIYAAARKWEPALDIASALITLVPDSPIGWVHRSFCLHELKRTAVQASVLVLTLRFGLQHKQLPMVKLNSALKAEAPPSNGGQH